MIRTQAVDKDLLAMVDTVTADACRVAVSTVVAAYMRRPSPNINIYMAVYDAVHNANIKPSTFEIHLL